MRYNSKLLIFMITATFFISLAWGLETKDIYKASIDSSGFQNVEMLGGSYFFKPNYVIVKMNVPVRIIVKKNSGYIPHNIVMHSPEAGMDFKVELTESPQTISFTPLRLGKYPFFCDHGLLFLNHRDKGMEGVIEVTE